MSRDQFEQRMRARRVATCVRAARQAIVEGRLVDAQERLDEACRLDPDAAEPRLLLEELQAGAVADLGAPRGPSIDRHGTGAGWSHWLAAAVAILALATLAFFWPPEQPPGRETPARRTTSTPTIDLPAAVEVQPPMLPVLPTDARANHADTSVPTAGRSVQAEAAAVERAPRPTTAAGPARPSGNPDARRQGPDSREAVAGQPDAVPKPQDVRPDPDPAADATGPERNVVARSAVTPPVTPSPVLPALRPPAGEPVDAEAGHAADSASRSVDQLQPALRDAVPASQPAAPPVSPGATVPAAEPVANDEEQIRTTLGRYADAYARLDAEAARQVWPGVDAQALRRAFDGLESQGLTFDRCDLRVTGAQATAACRGRARFVPKIGAREPMTVSRLWVFSLRKGDAGWVIQTADAR
jgi:hypothetical protein